MPVNPIMDWNNRRDRNSWGTVRTLRIQGSAFEQYTLSDSYLHAKEMFILFKFTS